MPQYKLKALILEKPESIDKQLKAVIYDKNDLYNTINVDKPYIKEDVKKFLANILNTQVENIEWPERITIPE